MSELSIIDLTHYVTQEQAAVDAKVAFHTIRTYAYCGKIPTTKILGRVMIHRDDLEAFKNRKAVR
jgi:hypothetical protein